MARLFLTDRELNFISDITKEIVRDVVGQRIYLYCINEQKTKTHGVYNEALQKVFDPPVALDCLVDNEYQQPTKTDQFGPDARYTLDAFVQYRDLIDRGVDPNIGDFFSFAGIFYEITDKVVMRNIYGLPEHKDGVKLSGVKAREGLFTAPVIGPTDIADTQPDAVQHTFFQQRGASENQEGETADKRDLIDNGTLDKPLGGPREVSNRGDDDKHVGSSFYDEEDS